MGFFSERPGFGEGTVVLIFREKVLLNATSRTIEHPGVNLGALSFMASQAKKCSCCIKASINVFKRTSIKKPKATVTNILIY